ncbi:MAG: ferritin-like domain-containing protein [Halomonas sp.]|nr:ferritin-like domain-containing protein [Halomonas sp.]TVP51087.1 MAG: ferritin-like domain-containing protein [Halomonas sp.]
MDSKHLVDWLRDAHAMEKQAEKMLSSQAERLENYPELQRRIEEHIEETRHQAEKLEHCLSLLGADVSTFKDLGAQLTAFGQAVGGMMAEDEVVKGGIACYSFENFEIASYKALIKAAEILSQPEVAQICKEILQEEIAMADWLSNNLDDTTQRYLERDEDDDLRAKT